MKKILVSLFLGLFLFSLVLAAQGNQMNSLQNNDDSVQNQQQNSGIGQQLSEQIQERKQEIKQGNYTIQGQMLQVRELSQNLRELRIRNISVHTELNITQEQEQNRTRLFLKLKNGNESEIKIMPDTAAETALQRLRLKLCNETNNCTLELKEVGQGNQTKAAYELQVERHYKLLGLFQAKAQNKIQIEAENGSVIQENKPWWAFLASEQD